MSDFWSKPWSQITAAILFPSLSGFASGMIVRKNMKSWYEHLNHSKFRPPNYVFPIVWKSLYCSMGYASYLVWKDGGGFNGAARLPLMLYGAQYMLNMMWTPLFFGMHLLDYSLINIIALTATATATGIAFFSINKLAGLLFIPYVGWLSFATYLNYKLYKMNPAIEDKKSKNE